MHKLIDYICEELEDLERKAEKESKLSPSEIQYGDMLAHFKKNLLTAEAMQGSDLSYEGGSYARGGNRGGNRSRRGGANQYGSYARGGQSNERGMYSHERGYSMDTESMVDELRELMQDAPDERTKQEFHRFIEKIERM